MVRPRQRRGAVRRGLIWLQGLLICALVGTGYVAWLDRDLRQKFEQLAWDLPARVYARALELGAGSPLSAQRTLAELQSLGYRRASGALTTGQFDASGDTIRVATRGHRFHDGVEPPRTLRLQFSATTLLRVSDGRSGDAIDVARLEPLEIGRIHVGAHQDRLPVRLANVPPALLQGLITTEDRHFFRHRGLDVGAIVRAAWVNLRAAEIRQGGSTLTQQLIKNLYLKRGRSWWRKVKEALLAVLLERSYSKTRILEAYVNEVFLGQAGSRAIHGFGLAAEFYFQRPLAELEVHELALLVGLVRGPSHYDPRRRPERSRARRNLVLENMARFGYLAPARLAALKARALGLREAPRLAHSAQGGYLELVHRHLRRDYSARELRTQGLRIYTNFDPFLQQQLDQSVGATMGSVSQDPTLQVAAIVADYRTGAVLALRGGRRAGGGQFNRALDALRPVGSLIKPAVYLTAIGARGINLATRVDDSALSVRVGNATWSPANYDGRSHGDVAAIDALSRSYNIATVRLGMQAGLSNLTALLGRLGVERRYRPYPSLLLGALEITPLEVAQMYQSLANGGHRLPLRTVRSVVSRAGSVLSRARLEPRQAADPRHVFLIQHALEEAMRTGTGRRGRPGVGAKVTVAGKTGTTNERRDSWFAGYAGELLAVVWLGRDDNAPTGLTGSSGALMLWKTFMTRARPRPVAPAVPDGIRWLWVDELGRVTDAHCRGARRLPFVRGVEPSGRARCPAERPWSSVSSRVMGNATP